MNSDSQGVVMSSLTTVFIAVVPRHGAAAHLVWPEANSGMQPSIMITVYKYTNNYEF